MSRIRAAYLLTVLLVAASAAAAQQPAAPLPLDPAVRAGTLPNGLTYFIRRNARPEGRVLLRLAVKAGSVDEADDQRGLAHVLEHMAFNGTAHFKPGELVRYLESIGARFGPHVNAYTSFDETVYMLDVPTLREGAVTRGFEALADFGGGISLLGEEIDRERGVVIEEWRGRQGASTRMQQPQIDALFGASKYAQRLPIGTPESLRTFTHERLRDFYRDHYRPDRMAVVVVGDIDPAQMEQQVRTHFAPLRATGAAPRPAIDIPAHEDTRYVTVSDPEAQGSSVSIIHKRPQETLRTATDYRRLLVLSLMNQMINSRFGEIARQAEAPFLGAQAGGSSIGRTMESFDVSARVRDGGIERGLAALATELTRVREHGFGDAELDRGKRALLASYERLYNERDKSESGGYASELVTYFLTGEAAPGIEVELQLVRQFLPTITAAEVATAARALIPDRNRVVLATSPEKAGLAPVTQAALREALRAGASVPVTAWKDDIAGRELMAKAPDAGRVTGRREIAELGVTVLTLSNGAEVWLKPTDFRNDQVSFSAYAHGGISLAGEENYQNASLATALVGLSGIGGLTPTDLGKLLAGRLANASPYISTYTHGVQGGSTPRDLETALQLAHLAFTAPNRDPGAFQLLKQRLEASLANQDQNPGSVFGERVGRINTSDHYTARRMTPADIGRLDPERMLRFYQERFANAANFTFFFVGAFSEAEITPLLTKYIASLPSTGKKDAQFAPLRLRFPGAVVREQVSKGREPRSQTVISFFADASQDEMEAHRLRAATQVLQNRLRDILREELGGTYSVGAGYSDTAPESGYGTTTVQFGSSPENVDKLVGAVMTELDRLRREGPSDADVQAVKEAEKNDLQNSFKQNGYWLNSLQTMSVLGRDPRRIAARVERADSLNRENIHAAFRKYFPPDRHTVVTLVPETATN